MKIIYFWLLVSLNNTLVAATLDDIHWGFDAKSSLLFDSAEQCANAVQKAVQQQGFKLKNTLYPEDGPTIFADSADQSQKSLSKCLLATGTVVTVVVGAGNNLPKAVAINNAAAHIYQQGQFATVDNWQAHLTLYPKVEKVPAMQGHVVLGSPTRGARIIKQIDTPGLLGCAAYVDTAEGRFYMSEFSLKRYQQGHTPSWIFIFPSVQP